MDSPYFDVAATLARAKAEEFRLHSLQESSTEARDALRSIVRIAKLYPEALLPTPLMAAIYLGAKVVDEEYK